MSRLTKEKRLEMLSRFSAGESIATLTEEFRLNRWQVYHLTNREKVNAAARARIALNLGLHNRRCRKSKFKDRVAFLERSKIQSRALRAALKKAATDKLGGKCANCGYAENIHALQIDHVNGDGYLHRQTQSNNQLYRLIVNSDDPLPAYQVLCANCNVIKRAERREYSKGSKRRVFE